MRTRTTFLLVGLSFSLALASLACADGDAPPTLAGPWRAAVDTIGDTVVVRTTGGSEWGGAARLVEELRIGARAGEDHEMFGQIGALAVTPVGDILVYDALVPVLRRFAPDGAYLGAIGRAGSGPGEYRGVAGMAVLEDGRVVLNDFGNGRFNVYGPDGAPLATWPLQPAIAERRPVYLHADGVFLQDVRFRDDGSWEQVLARVGSDGTPGDTALIPHGGFDRPALEVRSATSSMGMAVPFTPERAWTVTPAGEIAALLGDRYAVDIHRAEGSVLRIAREVDPVPVSEDERAVEEARITAFFRRAIEGWRWDGPSIPATKPPISWVHAGGDGRIWVRVAQPGTAIPEAERDERARTFVREPIVFDVYEPDGRFLGQVRAPDELRLSPFPVFGRDRVWAVVADSDGVEYVARFRIVADG